MRRSRFTLGLGLFGFGAQAGGLAVGLAGLAVEIGGRGVALTGAVPRYPFGVALVHLADLQTGSLGVQAVPLGCEHWALLNGVGVAQPLVRLCVRDTVGVPIEFAFLDHIAIGVDVLGYSSSQTAQCCGSVITESSTSSGSPSSPSRCR